MPVEKSFSAVHFIVPTNRLSNTRRVILPLVLKFQLCDHAPHPVYCYVQNAPFLFMFSAQYMFCFFILNRLKSITSSYFQEPFLFFSSFFFPFFFLLICCQHTSLVLVNWALNRFCSLYYNFSSLYSFIACKTLIYFVSFFLVTSVSCSRLFYTILFYFRLLYFGFLSDVICLLYCCWFAFTINCFGNPWILLVPTRSTAAPCVINFECSLNFPSGLSLR